MKQVKRTLWGGALIVLGVLMALAQCGVVAVDPFFDGWWALLLIIPCTIGALTDYDKTWDIVGIIVGVLLLLACQDAFNTRMVFRLVLPVAIILLGLRLVLKGAASRGDQEAARRAWSAGSSLPEYSTVFRRSSRDYSGEDFSGGEFTAAFGRLDCDLSGAAVTHEAVIRVNGIFGHVVLTLPADADVVVSSHALFGGVTNKRVGRGAGTIRVYVSGSCAFGGVTIR